LPASAFRDVLENSADPHDWFGAPGVGLLESVHRQGAGMLDIPGAIDATTAIHPGKLSLGESQAGPATRTLTLTNSSNASVTYDLSHVEAVGTGPETFPPLSFWLPDTQVVFSAPSVTVPAHGSGTVSVTITADPVEDDIPTGGLYGGYLVFQDHANADSVFTVPYAGYKGDYQSIVAIPNAPVIGKLRAPFVKAQQIYDAAPANEVWTLQSPDEIPNVLIHFDHQVCHLELQVVDAATGKPVHPVLLEHPRAGLSRETASGPRPVSVQHRSEQRRRDRVPVGRDADAGQRRWHARSPQGRARRLVQDRREGSQGRWECEQPGRLGDEDVADDHDRPPVAEGSVD
jgi:hypothetical protein